jgi:general secretion pathway protein G
MRIAEERIEGRFHGSAGFTLVEVMLVVVILGILATVAVVATSGKTKRASIAATRATISAVGAALDAFEVDNGTYPNSLQELISDTGNATWQGPYLKSKSLPADAWGNALSYSKSDNSYELVSSGPDGTRSGDDITN